MRSLQPITARIGSAVALRHFGFNPHQPDTAETKWERALVEFSAQKKAPDRTTIALLTRDVLNRHTRASVMGFAQQSLRSEFHIPLAVVVALSQLAVDVARSEFVAHSLECARKGKPVVTHPAARDDTIHQLFDSCMRHVSLTAIRRARGSEFFGGTNDSLPGPNRPSPDANSTGKETGIAVWEAAVGIMSRAHYCGVLQHEYDAPPEDIRINATSRIWRNFTVSMVSEAVDAYPGRSAWENALSLLGFLTPIPKPQEPPCCGFTTSDDELNVTRAVEECLGRHQRRDELLRWWKYVRNTDPAVNRHVCVSTAVGTYAHAVAERRKGAETRDAWGIEQDVRGHTCISNLLKLLAPNAVVPPPAGATVVQLGDGVIATTGLLASGAFIDARWQQTEAQVRQQDEALTNIATSAPKPVQ